MAASGAKEKMIGARIRKSTYAKVLRCQRTILDQTGIKPSFSSLVDVLLHQAAANYEGPRRKRAAPSGDSE